jgi:hypothetical protein
MLLVTDAEGNTIRAIRPEDFSKQYLPKKYWNDVTSDYTWGFPDPYDV